MTKNRSGKNLSHPLGSTRVGIHEVRQVGDDRKANTQRSEGAAGDPFAVAVTLRGVPNLDQYMAPRHRGPLRSRVAEVAATLRGAARPRETRRSQADEDSVVRPKQPPSGSGRVHLVGAVDPRLAAKRTRVFSLLMLCLVVIGLGSAGHTAYHALRDCYIAPSILSPNSDLVIASKLRIDELTVERQRASAELESVQAGIAADEESIGRLREIRAKQQRATELTAAMSSARASAGAAELRTIGRQRRVIATMLAQQRKLTEQARADVETGVISRTDYAKESQTLNQIELALLDNERAKFRGEPALGGAGTAEARRSEKENETPPSPELLARDVEAIRVDLEIMRLESDRRSKLVQRAAEADRVAKLTELMTQLMARPIYQAVDKSIDVAFVPYTQIDGLAAGAKVFSCKWGLFFCKQVGTVADRVPGEAVAADPWGGTSTRGEYVVLELWDRDSAKLKTLRVRREAPPSPSDSAAAPSDS